jgi:hypothetical protein
MEAWLSACGYEISSSDAKHELPKMVVKPA